MQQKQLGVYVNQAIVAQGLTLSDRFACCACERIRLARVTDGGSEKIFCLCRPVKIQSPNEKGLRS
jgi:hypothetical protein